jgi:hypothetical protein
MLVMYLCVMGIDIGLAFLCEGIDFWSCICVLREYMLVMHLYVRVIVIGHVFVS